MDFLWITNYTTYKSNNRFAFFRRCLEIFNTDFIPKPFNSFYRKSKPEDLYSRLRNFTIWYVIFCPSDRIETVCFHFHWKYIILDTCASKIIFFFIKTNTLFLIFIKICLFSFYKIFLNSVLFKHCNIYNIQT